MTGCAYYRGDRWTFCGRSTDGAAEVDRPVIFRDDVTEPACKAYMEFNAYVRMFGRQRVEEAYRRDGMQVPERVDPRVNCPECGQPPGDPWHQGELVCAPREVPA